MKPHRITSNLNKNNTRDNVIGNRRHRNRRNLRSNSGNISPVNSQQDAVSITSSQGSSNNKTGRRDNFIIKNLKVILIRYTDLRDTNNYSVVRDVGRRQLYVILDRIKDITNIRRPNDVSDTQSISHSQISINLTRLTPRRQIEDVDSPRRHRSRSPLVDRNVIAAGDAANTTVRTDAEIMPPPPAPVLAPPPPRRAHAAVPHKVTWRWARTFTNLNIETMCGNPFFCGPLTDQCQHCKAKFFTKEPRNRDGLRLSCCKNNKIRLPLLGRCPIEIKNLYVERGPRQIEFRDQIRLVNSLFAMASFKTTRPDVGVAGQGHWCFTVCGQVYHFTEGVPDTQNLNNPRLHHYYFLDVDEALNHRRAFVDDRVNDRTLEEVETALRRVNRYIQAYETMGEVLREEQLQGRHGIHDDIMIGIVRNPIMNTLRRNYNMPESRSDIAAVFRGTEPPFEVDLILYPRNRVRRDNIHHEVKNLNPMTDPMVYPLLFPCGDDGYATGIKHTDDATKTVTFREFYRYRIQIRDGFYTLHCGGKLYQQYLADVWLKVEANLLWFYRQNQNKFRRASNETLRRINEAREREGIEERVGSACVLPASFYGGERHRQRQYLDAMSVVARHGKPDIFITFTCNPRWIEIMHNLEYTQKWENRPDLVCRVFHVKFMEFMHDVTHKQVFGVMLNYHYVIEFQKRGLPHAHVMITLRDEDKLLSPEAIDAIISAMIPDIVTQPLLYQLVAEYQIHRPCGRMNPNAPCMSNNKCTKYYPREYSDETRLRAGDNNRPLYKRPSDGRTIIVPGTRSAVTNRRIVPFNPYMLAKFQSHINVEAVGSLLSMKYLFKYVAKGPDCITLVARDPNAPVNAEINRQQEDGRRQGNVDEIQQYLDCRYVSSMEAAWRLLEFKMSDRSHAVLVLPVHLPGENIVYYDELNDDLEDIEDRLGRPSKLEAWFALNLASEEARTYKYAEIPENYTWNGKRGRWDVRQKITKIIGCIAEVSPSPGQMEKHFLRLLLVHVRGATSFEDLRTVDAILHDTFHDACSALNLLRHVDEYDRCLAEAVIMKHPRRLRRLFGLICCVVADEGMAEIPFLWRKYNIHFIEDFVRDGMDIRAALQAALHDIEIIVVRNKDVTLDVLGITIDDDMIQNCTQFYEREFGNDLRPQLNDGAEEEEGRPQNYDPSMLNDDQKKVFLRVLRAVSRTMDVPIPDEILEKIGGDIVTFADDLEVHDERCVYYLDGSGGTGKTYLYNTLLTVLQTRMNQSTVAVAYTGIAASLLIGGTTAHRAFKLPFDLDEEAVAGWPLEHEKSNDLRNVSIIIWDEAPMTPKLAIEAVDKYFRDILENEDTPFGGKVVLFGGDFRQILPVVIGGSRNEVIESTLKRSNLWPELIKLRLFQNMRVGPGTSPDPLLGHETFANWLLRLGEGRLPYATLHPSLNAPIDLVEIPMCIVSPTFEDLINFVYEGDYMSPDAGSKAILCPTNVAVDRVNLTILNLLEGETRSYFSVDEYKRSPEDDLHVPIDVLNSISSPGLPPHELALKVGAVVMLLRNIDVDDGQCNGTRLRVTALHDHLIECEFLSSHQVGFRIWLPKIKMTARDTALPSELVRTQFPIKLAYAMTINKSQGQTLSRVGVYLNRPCFTHGQLYVALSRVGTRDRLRIFMEELKNQGTFKFRGRKFFTRNVIFYAVLSDRVEPLPPRLIYPNIGEDEDTGVIPSKRPYLPIDEPWDIREEDQLEIDRLLDQGNDKNADNVVIDERRFQNEDFMDDDEDILEAIARLENPQIPNLSDKQLENRTSTFDQPGTSGIRFRPPPASSRRSDTDSSDDD